MRDIFQSDEPVATETKPAKERNEDKNTGKKTGAFKTLSRHFERRLKSEIFLEDALPWHFKAGEAYHSFTFGDVDALTYLRAILKQQPLEYVCLSTFSMAITDAETLVKWQQKGLIGQFDLYLGEIFDSKFVEVYNTLRDAAQSWGGEWLCSAITRK